MSEFYSSIKRNISKKSEQLTFTHFKEMALFAAIGDRFIAKILKQVANDYSLDFEEMKTRYCGKSSFELMVPTKQVEVDLEAPEPEVESEPEIEVAPQPKKKAATKKKAEKVKEPKEDTSKKPMALSKMKKPELVAECEERGLDSEGTVAQLKERLKEARDLEGAAPKKKAPAKKAEKAEKAKEPKEKKKAPSKKKAAPPPPPPPEPLEEEAETEAEDEEPDSPGGIRAKMLKEAKNFEEEEPEEEEEEEEDLQERLRKILAEAEEEEFEDEDLTQIVDN